MSGRFSPLLTQEEVQAFGTAADADLLIEGLVSVRVQGARSFEILKATQDLTAADVQALVDAAKPNPKGMRRK